MCFSSMVLARSFKLLHVDRTRDETRTAGIKELRLQKADSDFHDVDPDDYGMNETLMNEDHEFDVARFT